MFHGVSSFRRLHTAFLNVLQSGAYASSPIFHQPCDTTRHDITGDGSPELFVTVESIGVCGTSGCDTFIFEIGPNGWRDLTSISVMISIRVGPELFLSDEVIDGYRTMYGEFYGLRWNGKLYDGFCVKRCEEG